MPAKYAALPNPRNDPDKVEDEMEAAFEGSDDEEAPFVNARDRHSTSSEDDDQHHHFSSSGSNLHSHPLENRSHSRAQSRPQTTSTPGAYDFENVGYDHPPPGSPPRRDRALPNNDWGNSNGLIPTAPVSSEYRTRLSGSRAGWFSRGARAILPRRVADRFVSSGSSQRLPIGGGTSNDGVFANVTAKPTVSQPVADGDGIYVLPETTQKEAPPSYAAAQADAVPPYWETTIHLPSGLGGVLGGGGSAQPGDLLIDGLTSGTLFSFLWNMLVSVSFNFVGFLITYLLHTTHAAKLGARAGLGVTLIQYGFALRSGRDAYGNYRGDGMGGGSMEGNPVFGGWTPPPMSLPGTTTPSETETSVTAQPSMPPTNSVPATDSVSDSDIVEMYVGDITNEWLAFLLMTIGWFILLTSLLGFWRVKRWERSILESQVPPGSQTQNSNNTRSNNAENSTESDNAVMAHLERTFGLRFPSSQMFRNGLGFREIEDESSPPDAPVRSGRDEEEVEARDSEDELLLFPSLALDHPDRSRLVAEAYANERRLQQDLRAAGLI